MYKTALVRLAESQKCARSVRLKSSADGEAVSVLQLLALNQVCQTLNGKITDKVGT